MVNKLNYQTFKKMETQILILKNLIIFLHSKPRPPFKDHASHSFYITLPLYQYNSLDITLTMSVTPDAVYFYANLAIHSLLNSIDPSYSKVSLPESEIATACDYVITPFEAPLFVTWNIINKETKSKKLRGCIGNFSKLPLPKSVKEYALISAFEDERFKPITLDEILKIENSPNLDLQCAVTILHSFEDITNNPLNWNIGEHGLHVIFKYGNRRCSATFLPEVAKEQGWSKKETLDALVDKSGAYGDWDTIKPIKVERYLGEKAQSTLSEFKIVVL